MENQENELNLTEEQKKELDKLVVESKKFIFWATIRFIGGLFGLNVLSFAVMAIFLLDASPETQTHFLIVAQIFNAILMYTYFYGQLRDRSLVVDEKIKEIIKKSE